MIRPLIRLAALTGSYPRWRFQRALHDPAASQAGVRARLARAMAGTEYGAAHGLKTAADWHRLPVVEYEDLRPWVDRQATSQARILTPEPPLFWERTSGSSGPSKLIPFTPALRACFSRMLRIWGHDLVTHGPHFTSGQVFFSVSPPVPAPAETAGGDLIGADDDRDFLDGWTQRILSPFLVRPTTIPADPLKYLDRVTNCLLRSPRLETLSIWSPSYLKVLMDHAEQHFPRLVGNCKAGQVVDRTRYLRREGTDWTKVWPDLKLVSCWDAGQAAPQAEWLRERLPGVLVQGKGLLATEGPVTIPLVGVAEPVPMIDEVVVELEDEHGSLCGIEAAVDGQTYTLVMSQPNGLLRYRLGDRVQACGKFAATPCLKFLGRGPRVSDMVGEKLSAGFVADILAALDLEPAFLRCLVPVRAATPRYLLVLDEAPAQGRDTLAARLEDALGAATHYRRARDLCQLDAATVCIRRDATEAVTRLREAAGVGRGDQKPASLVAGVDGASLLG